MVCDSSLGSVSGAGNDLFGLDCRSAPEYRRAVRLSQSTAARQSGLSLIPFTNGVDRSNKCLFPAPQGLAAEKLMIKPLSLRVKRLIFAAQKGIIQVMKQVRLYEQTKHPMSFALKVTGYS